MRRSCSRCDAGVIAADANRRARGSREAGPVRLQVYSPIGSASMMNQPDASVVALPVMLVPSAETMAPPIGPPRSSLTTPVMLPRTERADWYSGVWASAEDRAAEHRAPATHAARVARDRLRAAARRTA